MEAPRIVWITGASSGIGSELSKEFASHGDLVVLTARNRSKLELLHKQIREQGGTSEYLVCDVRNNQSVATTFKRIVRSHSAVDILVNNAGVTYFKDFLSTTIAEFDDAFATNLRGLFLTTKAVLPGMVKSRSGLILNILSFASKVTYTKSAAYAASKSGAEAMMNVLRAEVRDRGVKVVNVYPGAVETPMWLPRHRKKYSHRMISAKNVARLVYELTVQPSSVMVEELIIRPQRGDLSV